MSAKPTYQHAQETAWPLLVFELNEIRPICGSAWRRMLQIGEARDELSGVTAAVGMMSANELTAGRAVLLLGVHPLTSPSNLPCSPDCSRPVWLGHRGAATGREGSVVHAWVSASTGIVLMPAVFVSYSAKPGYRRACSA